MVPAFTAGKQVYRAVYFNDTWHVSHALTLNVGLRYELQGPWSERYNRLSYFDPHAQSYLNQFLPSGSSPVFGDVYLVPLETRNNIPLDEDNLAPRVGFAYSLTRKTVLRGGFSLNYDQVNFFTAQRNQQNPPYATAISAAALVMLAGG